ncbi:MAG: hypothetical protein H7239_13120 [Flavobacterium sp.]|nr:hypothetical protein [Flavobacterium sp.]
MKSSTQALETFYLEREKYEARFFQIRQEGIQAAEELFKQPISDEELDKQIAEMFEVHGQKNPNKPRCKK